jgi:hypothetical protein
VTQDLEKKMAVIEYRVDELSGEQKRIRDRIHSLEADRGTLKLIVEQMGLLVSNMEQIAQRAAEQTVRAMLEQRAAGARTWRDEIIRFVQLGIALAGLYLISR